MPERQNTTPDVPRGEKGKWLPGASPNPGGRPKALRDIEKMLDAEHRNPENMRAVFDRLRALALGEVVRVPGDGDEPDQVQLRAEPAFMKLYLERVMGPVKELEPDLADAPDEVLRWFVDHN